MVKGEKRVWTICMYIYIQCTVGIHKRVPICHLLNDFNGLFCPFRSIYVQSLSIPFYSVLCHAMPFHLRGGSSSSTSVLVLSDGPLRTFRVCQEAQWDHSYSAREITTLLKEELKGEFERRCDVMKARSLLVSLRV